MRLNGRLLLALLFIGTIATLTALDYAQAPPPSGGRILAAEEGDRIADTYLKADQQTGSTRLGVGLQRLEGRQRIPLHKHDREDEILFVHSGSGEGTVGDVRKTVAAGTTIYIPQGTWHGVESDGGRMEILWVVSPPNYAQSLREIAAKTSVGRQLPSGELDEIWRKHGMQDSRHYFLPRLATIAAILALGAAFVAFLNRVRPFRSWTLYVVGTTLATGVTLFATHTGYLPPPIWVVGTIVVGLAVLIGALGGIGIGRLAHRR